MADKTQPQRCDPKENLPRLQDIFLELARSQQSCAPDPLLVRGAGEPTAVHGSDPVQSGHMDCFLIAALSAVAQTQPDPDRWLSRMVHPQPDGSYNVTFQAWGPGEPWNGIPAGIHAKTVNVHPEDFSHPADSDDDGEIWPAVVEKAYSIAFPDKSPTDTYGFDGGHPGKAMEALTGVAGESLKPADTTIAALADYQRQGYAMTVTTHGKSPMGRPAPPADKMPEYQEGGLIFFSRSEELNEHNNRIRPYHVYTVGKVDTMAGTVTVHNVWDKGRQDIVLPYDRFQVLFSGLDTNPVHPRRPH